MSDSGDDSDDSNASFRLNWQKLRQKPKVDFGDDPSDNSSGTDDDDDGGLLLAARGDKSLSQAETRQLARSQRKRRANRAERQKRKMKRSSAFSDSDDDEDVQPAAAVKAVDDKRKATNPLPFDSDEENIGNAKMPPSRRVTRASKDMAIDRLNQQVASLKAKHETTAAGEDEDDDGSQLDTSIDIPSASQMLKLIVHFEVDYSISKDVPVTKEQKEMTFSEDTKIGDFKQTLLHEMGLKQGGRFTSIMVGTSHIKGIERKLSQINALCDGATIRAKIMTTSRRFARQATKSAATTARAEPLGPQISLKICGSSVRGTIQMGKNENFSVLVGKCRETFNIKQPITLMLDGCKLDLKQTPQDEDLEDDDQIDMKV